MTMCVPGFCIEEVENFCFNLHYIQKKKTKQRSAMFQNARKICSTRNWKFYNILQKHVYVSWRESGFDFNGEKTKNVEIFDLICIASWKSLEYFLNRKWNFTTFSKKNTYMSNGNVGSRILY